MSESNSFGNKQSTVTFWNTRFCPKTNDNELRGLNPRQHVAAFELLVLPH